MNNTTLPGGGRESDTVLDSPGFFAYSILLTVIVLAAGVVMGISVAALALAKSIPRLLCTLLINLLLAGLVLAVGMIFLTFTSAVLVAVGPDHPRPPLYLCRVYLLTTSAGAVARLWSLAAFALLTLAIVRFGKKTISLRYTAVIIAILWLVPIVLSLFILIPAVYGAGFYQGVACFPVSMNTTNIPADYTLFAIWCLLGGLVPMTVSIAVPIICLCYIKKKIVTENIQYRKAMAKFSLFLVLGSAISIAGQLVPGLMALNSEASGVYLVYSIATISLIPTPIIIIAYLKPVREKIKKMFTLVTCGMLKKRAKDSQDSKWATSTPGTYEVQDKL